MPRILERALSPAFVNSVTEPGLYADGGCLYLQVTEGKHYDKALLKWVKNGRINKSWVFKFRAGKRERNMGLGAVRTVGLSEARAKARKLRQDRLDGIDPLEERNRARAAVAVAAAKTTTFDECAQAYMKAQEAGWRNAKHASQWRNTLSSYVSPVFGALPVRDIDTALVLKALEPIWTTKPETASRVRGRIELVLDWAKARGYREGGNPAQWKGHLKNLLPATRKVAKVKHLAAMPYLELPSFMAALRAQEGLAARALEFAVLTATRSGEVLGAVWDEVDLAARLWVVPGARTKREREHRVPLSKAALAVLERAGAARQNKFVFPGDRQDAPLSNAALRLVLRRMGHRDLTVHGFRSSFRDWAAERSNFSREIAEASLAHIVGDETERAYQRGDLLAKRAKLMQAWSEFCAKPAPGSASVTPIARGRRS